jgi:hypothetical protein
MQTFVEKRYGNPAWDEDLMIVAMMIGVGSLPIALIGLRGDGWGVQPTLGMLIVLFAANQLVQHGAARIREYRRSRRARRLRTSTSASEI